MKLKICQIQDSPTAFQLLRAGVNYLGFHVLDPTQTEQAFRSAAVNTTLRANGFEGGVLLTKADDVSWIVESAVSGAYRHVQVHHDTNPRHIEELASLLHDAGTSLIQVVDPTMHDAAYVTEILTYADYVLYDNYVGGTGRRISDDDLRRMPMDRAFIAGGIDDVRARELKARFSPYAIDVQSWVKQSGGSKNLDRVMTLVDIAGSSA